MRPSATLSSPMTGEARVRAAVSEGTRRGVKCLHAHVAWSMAGGDDPVGRWTLDQLGLDLTGYGPERFLDTAADAAGATAVAAIDCGTNSTRLLIVDGAGQSVERLMRITRLGEDVDATHKLSSDAISRTVAVLTEFRAHMDAHGVSRGRLVATSAVRDAGNAEEFLTPAERVTGIAPEVLSGEEEGRLSFAGATAHLQAGQVGPGPLLVVDIGGGSTEISAGVFHPQPQPQPRSQSAGPAGGGAGALSSVSLDIGCVRITERFLHHDPPEPEELAEARRVVDEALNGALERLPVLQRGGGLVGLAGTVSTLASLSQGLDTYDRALVHHAVLSRAEVDDWLQILGTEDSQARLERPGMVAGRADVIVGGVLILTAVMAVFDRPSCLVSEDDILDGLAATVR
jgi:exopolyphosphatase/guanosine-5'-triphosphate,3'-diphosphate pyrophosphatase